MSKPGRVGSIPFGCSLLGEVDYYCAILGKKDIVTREGDFRASKLGLIIDLIKVIDAPDDMISNLTTAIIDAWRLGAPERSIERRAQEMNQITSSMEALKRTIQMSKDRLEPDTSRMIDIAVLCSLPLIPSDLSPNGSCRVREQISRLANYLFKHDSLEMKICCV
jgi:hypothetical protein